MLGMDGAEHAAARRPVIGEFTVKRLAALRPRIQAIVDHFIDDLLATDQRPVDLVLTDILSAWPCCHSCRERRWEARRRGNSAL